MKSCAARRGNLYYIKIAAWLGSGGISGESKARAVLTHFSMRDRPASWLVLHSARHRGSYARKRRRRHHRRDGRGRPTTGACGEVFAPREIWREGW